MALRPKSVIGYVFLFMISFGVGYVVISGRDTLSNPWLWAPVAVIVAMSLVAFAWHRRVEAARERAWDGSFSFDKVVARRRAEEALRRAESTG